MSEKGIKGLSGFIIGYIINRISFYAIKHYHISFVISFLIIILINYFGYLLYKFIYNKFIFKENKVSFKSLCLMGIFSFIILEIIL